MIWEFVVGAAVGGVAGYFIGKYQVKQSTDISTQLNTIQGLTTQIAEMKGKFTEIEKSRVKLEETQEKRIKQILEDNNKFYKEMKEGNTKSEAEKEKRLKEILDKNNEFIKQQKDSTEKFLKEQGESRESIEKKRDAQVLDMQKMVSKISETVSGTKRRGEAGEVILKEVLSNSIKAGLVKTNLRVGSKNVEFAWNLGDGKYVPIDAKFPEIDSLLDSLSTEEDVDNRKKLIKELKKKAEKEISNIQKYHNTDKTIDSSILVFPPVVLDYIPEIVGAGKESNVFVASFKDVFLIANILQEQYVRMKEEGDVGVYKKMVEKLFGILEKIQDKTSTIDRAIKQITNANNEIQDNIVKGNRLK